MVSSPSQVDDLILSIAKLVGTDQMFDNILDHIVAQIRIAWGVPDEEAETEFLAARNRMDKLRPEYDALYAKILREHLGTVDFQHLKDAISAPPVQALLRAQITMQRDFDTAFRVMAKKIHAAATYDEDEDEDE